MDQSPVYRHFEYLRDLGLTEPRERQTILRHANRDRLLAILEVNRAICNGAIVLLERDYRVFRRKRRVLRQLVSPSISLTRKKAILLRQHALLPRLLRDFYLIQVVILSDPH